MPHVQRFSTIKDLHLLFHHNGEWNYGSMSKEFKKQQILS